MKLFPLGIILIVCAGTCGFAAARAADSPCAIAGRVLDGTKPVAGAKVVLYEYLQDRLCVGPLKSVTTSSDGAYRFDGLHDSGYLVKATLPESVPNSVRDFAHGLAAAIRQFRAEGDDRHRVAKSGPAHAPRPQSGRKAARRCDLARNHDAGPQRPGLAARKRLQDDRSRAGAQRQSGPAAYAAPARGRPRHDDRDRSSRLRTGRAQAHVHSQTPPSTRRCRPASNWLSTSTRPDRSRRSISTCAMSRSTTPRRSSSGFRCRLMEL